MRALVQLRIIKADILKPLPGLLAIIQFFSNLFQSLLLNVVPRILRYYLINGFLHRLRMVLADAALHAEFSRACQTNHRAVTFLGL